MVSRNAIYDKTLRELPLDSYVQGDSVDSLLASIVPDTNQVVLFSDYHGSKFPVDLLLSSLPFLSHHGYNQFMLEMLPMRVAPYTSIDEIIALVSIKWKDKTGEISVIDSCREIAIRCLELGIEIIGGDIDNYHEMRTRSELPRYEMNKTIADRIKQSVGEGKKVISFFGVEHNNTRTRVGIKEQDDYLGIPYYLGDTLYLVIKDIRMSYSEPYLKSLLPRGYVALKTEPVVDYPHFFIKTPTEGGRKRSKRKRIKKTKKYLFNNMSSLSISELERVSSLEELIPLLQSYDIHDVELIKSAISSTNGKLSSILLFLVKHVPPGVQTNIFLRNRTLLSYPEIEPPVVNSLIMREPTIAKDIDLSALIKALKQYPLAAGLSQYITDPELVHAILLKDPTLFEICWKRFVTKDMLLKLGFHTIFTIEDVVSELSKLGPDETVGLVAMCHGPPEKISTTPCPITRYMNGPWNTCYLNGPKYSIPFFHKILAKNHIEEGEIYPDLFTRAQMQEFHDATTTSESIKVKVKHRLDVTEGLGHSIVHNFKVGDRIIMKKFTDDSIHNDFEYDGIRFLLLKIRNKTYNLFSLQHSWLMKDILDMLGGRRLVFLDYSCNIIRFKHNLTPEELSTLGGKPRKPRKRSICKKRLKRRTKRYHG